MARCDNFLTDGDGWSDQMHADILIGAESLPTDQFAWAVSRDSSVLGTSGYTYRVTVTDPAAGESYDSGLVSVPACATTLSEPPTELPSTGFPTLALILCAVVFIGAGLVGRIISNRRI